MKKAESAYLGKLQRMGCIACRLIFDDYQPPEPGVNAGDCSVVIHHPREGQGGAQRAQNWLAIPLCVYHHTGAGGVHKNGNYIPTLKMDEMDLLSATIETYHQLYIGV